jgi:hypothetical protein
MMVRWKNRSDAEKKAILRKQELQKKDAERRRKPWKHREETTIPIALFGSEKEYFEYLCDYLGMLSANDLYPEKLEEFAQIHKVMKATQERMNVFSWKCKMLGESVMNDALMKQILPKEKYEEFKEARGKMASKLLDPKYDPCEGIEEEL